MKAKRPWFIIFILAVLALALVTGRWLFFEEPTYAGKTVSVWFAEYAYATNAVGPQPARIVFINQKPVWQMATPAPPDPAWEALRALGSNAVPCLVQHLRYGPLDRAYESAVTNLPAFLQRKLPNPMQRRWYRIRALQALAQLRDAARPATPAVLALLRKREPLLRSQVLATLRSIYADGHSISGLLLQLGAQRRYPEVLEIARETKWEGREVARLFGAMLDSPDTTLHRDAIKLLEAAGERAAPALDSILAALHSPDGEVRYLAARAVENISPKAPAEARLNIELAMQACLSDEREMVRNVASRVLSK